MVLRALVVADAGDDDPGWVGERLVERGARLILRHRGDAGPVPASDLVLLLGSADAVHDPRRTEAVETEAALVRDHLGRGVPVIGICYGAQLIAHALGGTVRPVERGEVGWFDVTSLDGRLCPTGPWLQFHSDVFTVPPGARLLGTSPLGPQGFAVDPADGAGGVVAWQFHPEATPDVVTRWVHEAADYVVLHGGDPRAVVRTPPGTRAATAALVDAALEHLGVDPGRMGT